MSHLIFDTRDWKFILNEQLDLDAVLSMPVFSDFDADTCNAIIDELVKLAVDKIAPVNNPGDREGCHLVDGRVITPAAYTDAFRATQAAGWIAATKRPKYGGMGLPHTVTTAVAEAIGGASMAFSMYPGLSSEAAELIENFGTDALAERFVPRMYSGEFGGTMCLTESQAGSAVGDSSSSAALNEDGTYNIEGSKIFISGGDAPFYDNVVHLVLARIKGDPDGIKGISLFAVPRLRVNDDGSLGAYNNVSVDALEHKMGINGSATCQISFGADGPCAGYLVGEPCAGIVYMFQMMNHARIAVGLQGTGLANASYQQALRYAKERRQGSSLTNMKGASVEIINHPDVRRNLMFMKAYSEGLRALVAWAAWLGDIAGHGEGEAAAKAQNLLDLMTPIVKSYGSDKGFKVTELGVQIFGGYGFTQDFPVELYLRDCKITSIYEGTNGIQALDLLGRKMRMKGGALFMTYVQDLSTFVDANKERPELADSIVNLAKAQAALGEVAFWVSSNAKKNISLALLQATPFLELFGDVVVGHMLFWQATVALDAMQDKFGTTTPTKEQREDNSELAFYAGKVANARFFSAEVLLWAKSKVKSMTTGETAALDMVF